MGTGNKDIIYSSDSSWLRLDTFILSPIKSGNDIEMQVIINVDFGCPKLN
jgi:hypothetical protein